MKKIICLSIGLLAILLSFALNPIVDIRAEVRSEAEINPGIPNYTDINYKFSNLTISSSLSFQTVTITIDSGDIIVPSSSQYTLITDILPMHRTFTIKLKSSSNSGVVQSILRTIQFTPVKDVAQKVTFTLDANITNIQSENITAFLHEDGTYHYYMFVGGVNSNNQDIAWAEAYANAKNLYYNGMQGYLATITSAKENTTLKAISTLGGWSAGIRIKTAGNSLDGNSAPNYKGGDWVSGNKNFVWSCGPEAGKAYYEYTSPNNKSSINNQFNGFTISAEPNNWKQSGQNYNSGEFEWAMQINFGSTGGWNDLNPEPKKYYPPLGVNGASVYGYFVEFGGKDYAKTHSNYNKSNTIEKTVSSIGKVNFVTSKGTTPANQILKYGEKITMPIINYQGMSIEGWYLESDFKTKWNFTSNTITGDMTLYAKWTSDLPNITSTLLKSGKVGEKYEQIVTASISSGNIIFTATGLPEGLAISQTGIISGFPKSSGTSTVTIKVANAIDNTAFTVKEFNLEITDQEYFVIFDANGRGTAPNPLYNILENHKITEPVLKPSSNGYSFEGWYKEQSCLNKYDFENDVIAANTILYAKWEELYKVSFENYGLGNKPAGTEYLKRDSLLVNPGNLTANGYIFKGWFTEKDQEWNFETDRISQNMTLHAKWEELFRASFENNGLGIKPNSTDFLANQSLIPNPGDLTSTGYAFKGWFTDQDLLWDFDVHTITMNLKLYAKWEQLYQVIYENNGLGDRPNESDFLAAGSKIENNPVLTEKDYKFYGWFKEATFENAWNFELDCISSSNQILYAKWIPIFLVQFENQGFGMKPADQSGLEASDKVKNPGKLTHSGYDFIGWYKNPECTQVWDFVSEEVITNRTIYAKWDTKFSSSSVKKPTADSITIETLAGTEYKLTKADGTLVYDWIPGTGNKHTFNNLENNQQYKVIARTTTSTANGTEKVVNTTTDRGNQSKPTLDEENLIVKISRKEITIHTEIGKQYSIDGGITWINGTGEDHVFKNLETSTEYKILVRNKSTDQFYASETLNFELKTNVSLNFVYAMVVALIAGLTIVAYVLKRKKKMTVLLNPSEDSLNANQESSSDSMN